MIPTLLFRLSQRPPSLVRLLSTAKPSPSPAYEPPSNSAFGAKTADWRLALGGQYPQTSKRDLRIPLKTRDGLFTPFFHFPFIVHVRAIQRFKLLNTILASTITPGCLIAYGLEVDISPTVLALMMAANVSTFSLLLVTTFIFQRWIGRMYINEAKDKVLISHLTFWGQRNNVIFPIADITPLDHLTAGRYYVHVPRISDPKDHYTLCTRWGGVMDQDAFDAVFGSDTSTYFNEAVQAAARAKATSEESVKELDKPSS